MVPLCCDSDEEGDGNDNGDDCEVGKNKRRFTELKFGACANVGVFFGAKLRLNIS